MATTPVPIETTENPTLDASLEAASQSIENAPVETAPVETPTVETTETAPVETEQPPVETPEGEKAPADEDAQRAMQFWQALQNPETQPHVIEFLAKQAGYSLQKAQTEAAPQETAPTSVGEILAQHLGEEYAFLAPKLGSALEQALNAVVGPLREEIVRSRVTSEFDRATAALNERTKGEFKTHEKEIVGLMQRIKPAEGVPLQDYLDDLYHLAKAKKAPSSSTETAKKVVQRIQKNAQEALPSPSAATDARVLKGPNLPTLDEALAAAARGVTFE
jgi:hypothetical protein